MNFKTTAILLVLLAAGAFALWMTPSESKTDEKSDTKAPPSGQIETKPIIEPAPNENDIVKVVVERMDKGRLTFERGPKADNKDQMEDWRITEPIVGASETWVVQNLARTFATLQSVTSFEPGASGAVTVTEAGLELPRGVVTLTMKDGKQYKFEVGKNAVLSTDTYVRLNGAKKVFIARGELAKEINKDFKEFRSKNLLKATAADTARLELEHEGKKIDLSRGADKEWVMNAPVQAYADKEKVIGLITKLGALRVNEFIEDKPDTLTSYGLDQPWLKIAVTTETKKPISTSAPAGSQPAEPQFETVTSTGGVLIGAFSDMKSENRYIKLVDQPWVASVSKASLEGLAPKPGDLRDPKVTRVKAADAMRLELSSGGATAVLEKKDGKWVGTGDLAELENEAVSSLVEGFEDVKAVEYVDQPEDGDKYGLDKPRAIVKVSAAGAVAPVSLKIGANTPSGRNTYVQLEGQPFVSITTLQQAERLLVPPLSLRSRAILTCKSEDIQGIDVVRGKVHYIAALQGGQWKLNEPANAPADQAGMRQLANDMSVLRARKVVAKGADDTYGLKAPVAVVRVTLMKPPESVGPTSEPASQPSEVVTHTLRVGWANNTAYCRKNDDPYIFELDDTVYRVLIAELIKRELFDFSADAVIGFKVDAPQGKLDLAKTGDEWKYAIDPSVKISQKKVKDWLAELAKLRVENYLAYGDGDLKAEGLAEAPVTVTITLKGDRKVVVKIGQEQPNQLPRKAALVDSKRIAMLKAADAEKFLRTVDYYAGPDAPEKPATPGRPGMPQVPPTPPGGDDEEPG